MEDAGLRGTRAAVEWRRVEIASSQCTARTDIASWANIGSVLSVG